MPSFSEDAVPFQSASASIVLLRATWLHHQTESKRTPRSNLERQRLSQRRRRSIAKTNDAAAESNERTAATILVPTAIVHEHLRRIRAMPAAVEKVAELALLESDAALELVAALMETMDQQEAVQAQ